MNLEQARHDLLGEATLCLALSRIMAIIAMLCNKKKQALWRLEIRYRL